MVTLGNRWRFSVVTQNQLENDRKIRARERHINFEHVIFLKDGTTLGQPAG